MQAIRLLIKDTVQQSSREIANEAAQAAVNAFQARLKFHSTIACLLYGHPHSCLTPQKVHIGHPHSCLPRRAPRALRESPSLHPSRTSRRSISRRYKVVSFFELSKLLPKSLLLYDEGDNLVLSLENSAVKVSKKSKPTASTSITNIEQWTTEFTTYMSVLTTSSQPDHRNFCSMLV